MNSQLALLILALSFSPIAFAKRSAAAKYDFKQQHHCPSTGKGTGPCPGYLIESRQAAGLRSRGPACKHAMADCRGGEGEG